MPLGAEVKENDFKSLFLDVGLVANLLGLSYVGLVSEPTAMPAKSGLLAEQFIGQHLLYAQAPHKTPELFYWRRQSKSSNAKVDFLFPHKNQVIPVEVKSGKTGTLRSLHRFIEEKQTKIAVRFNRDVPSLHPLEAGDQQCRLISLPTYMVGQLPRLVGENL